MPHYSLMVFVGHRRGIFILNFGHHEAEYRALGRPIKVLFLLGWAGQSIGTGCCGVQLASLLLLLFLFPLLVLITAMLYWTLQLGQTACSTEDYWKCCAIIYWETVRRFRHVYTVALGGTKWMSIFKVYGWILYINRNSWVLFYQETIL